MTTMVTVEASSHDVEVIPLDPQSGDPIGITQKVEKGNKHIFYAHQGQDLYIEEVKDDA